jgi:isoleucyl-tRNA synthetase
MSPAMFSPLPDKPDHNALELEILALWDEAKTFDRLRAKNAEGPKFRFIDGPVTANKTLAVHTAWGRTLKDVFQRYKALNGFHQRYQNGFDCQGLWIEVGVEKELGLNSKREIEEYGLDKFAEKCRDVVVKSSQQLTAGSVRLGQWMDWGSDYFTFSDTNIEYIWRFLQIVEERGWLYKGHRSTEWCPRCGTSMSAHELAGSYIERTDPALTVRFPLDDRPGEFVVIWTTTPWTLPANVAAAVHPEADYGRLANGDWMAVARAGGQEIVETKKGADLVGWTYTGPFDALRTPAPHKVIAWDEVSMDEGTGIVHIAPGCGTDDFELAKPNDLEIITPVDEAGKFYADFGWLAGRGAHEAAEDITNDLRERGLLVHAGTIEHRYPECWRCHTPLIFRISDDWFIKIDDLRPQMREANAKVEWTPEYMGKRMDDWLFNMGDWNISRRRYYGLPLPFYPCSCGHVTVVGSKAELAELATAPITDLPELRRPWIDAIKIRCVECGNEEVERITEVGDVWLDAGIVPFSTLGWQNDRYIEGGYATGAAAGLTKADLPNHEYWEEWFPADWVSEMREQIRLWFYSQLCMSVVLTGEAPYRKVLGYEKMLDETGREMHGSWGNMIDAPDAFERMGADVMRWQFSAQPANQNLLFGFGPAHEIQRKLLTLWNSVAFFIQYANIAGFTPSYDELATGPSGSLDALDEWMVARTRRLIADTTDAYEAFTSTNVLRAFDDFVDDLSNWYVRRSRRRFWNGDDAALRTLWYSLVNALRVVSPVMPFLTEHLWQNLVTGVPGAPDSIFLAGWPARAAIDDDLLAEVAAMRTVVELARRARKQAGIRNRQPLPRLIVDGAPLAERHAQEIADELNVKSVIFGEIEAAELRVKPNLPVLGPRLGKELGPIRAALQNGEFEQLEGGRFRVGDHELEPNEVLVETAQAEGWAIQSNEGVSVGLDTTITDDLALEGRVNDLIHHVNNLRKETGLEITDRIHLQLASSDADLVDYAERIGAETLSLSVEVGDELTIRKS